MKVQSLSVVVPTGTCWNNCKFCVSKMHHEDYSKCTQIKKMIEDYIVRIKYAKDLGCNTLMLTGFAEPQQNLLFIEELLKANNNLENKFYNIEIQTSGSGMNFSNYNRLKGCGLTTVSLSICAPYDEKIWEIENTPIGLRCPLETTRKACEELNLIYRLSINLTDEWEREFPTLDMLFDYIKSSGARQVTFRVLYSSGDNSQSEWVKLHSASKDYIDSINFYIKNNGTPIRKLLYGQMVYSIDGVSVVMDDDCMAKNKVKELDDNFKYLILRPDGHLYSKWDDKGSIVF